jgi:lipopolysaccharide transport system permease protein
LSMTNSVHEVVIEAGRAERHYWADIWRYRELMVSLATREILVRYKQTVVGFAWAILRPTLTMLVFTLVFGKLAKLPTDGLPYPVLVLAGLLPWQLFSTAVTEGSNSLISNANMISKVYFPRIIVPVSSVAVSLADSLVAFAVLAIIMVGYGVVPSWHVLLLPLYLLLTCALSLGVAVLLSALSVRYRDFRYIVGFIVQFGLLISPIGFSSSVVSREWLPLYSLNPMVGVIEGFRWCLASQPTPLRVEPLVASLAMSVLLLVVAVRYFRATERTFADVI